MRAVDVVPETAHREEADFARELRRALGGDARRIGPRLLERLEQLDRLLVRWSSKVDLVGFSTSQERIRRYFAEPLAALDWLPSKMETAVDVGSGGGSPALPLALWNEQCRWRLVESRRKKSVFLEEASRALGLDNVRVSRERFEGGSPGPTFDVVTTRGVRLGKAELAAMLERIGPGGRFLWFSGEARLREGASALSAARGVVLHGPVGLLQGFPASLLVVEKAGPADPAPPA